MDLIKTLEEMMLVGSEWILYLLMALSVLTLAIALERFAYLSRTHVDFKEFCMWLSKNLHEGKYSDIEARCVLKNTPEHFLVLESLRNKERGSESLEYHLKLVIASLKQDMDRGILFLGTVGSNAPFVGLLGTVFGVIEAFHQLAVTGAGGSSAVMSGISEALVATAVGLIVAIPAVVFFNMFQRSIKKKVANLEALRDLILSHSKSSNALSRAA